MHRTSLLKAKSFVAKYVKPCNDRRSRILDVGSKSYAGHITYRSLFEGQSVDYVGLDLEPGEGVDIVPAQPFVWPELDSENFDFCVCGQVFEHNPMFWITFAEIARVLRPNGYAMVIAPGRGAVHRYPVDCWRFYPDAWHALCAYTGLELVETYFEDRGDRRREPSLTWCDCCVIAKKPMLIEADHRAAFYQQLARITSTAPVAFQIPTESTALGPALEHYKRNINYGKKRGIFAASKRFFMSRFSPGKAKYR